MHMAKRLLELESYSLSLIRQERPLPLLVELSLLLDAGEVVGLVGPSGSGKSMTISAIARLLHQKQPVEETGIIRLLIDDKPHLLTEMQDCRNLWKKHIGIVFQQSSDLLNPRQTVSSILSEKMENPNTSKIENLLASVGLTPPMKYINAYPFNLSGGQVQRVLIALALVNKPQLILADEPFSAVDGELKEELSQLLISLVSKYEIGLLLVSHDLQLIEKLADRVLFLDQGQLIEKPDFQAHNDSLSADLTDAGPVILEVSNLRKSYAKQGLFSSNKLIKIIDGYNLQLHLGEILGIQGPSGVGKSTLARLLAGMESPDSGHIRYKGQDISELSKSDRHQYFTKVQLIPQDPLSRMPPQRSVRAHFEDVFFVRKIAYDVSRVEEVMYAVQLDKSLLSRLPKQLSGGQRQRVLIAKSLLMNVDLLICDEIFSALDFAVQADIASLLRSLVAHKSLSIIMISHDAGLLKTYCHRVVKM